MRIEILNDSEEYKRLHELVFGRLEHDIPQVVKVGYSDSGDAVAFVAGFWISDDHFYIQYAGVLPEYQKRGFLRYFSAVLMSGVTYSISIINTNIIAIKIALSTGFIPNGFMIENGRNYLQLKREKHGNVSGDR